MNVKVLHNSEILLRLFKRTRACFRVGIKRVCKKKRPVVLLCVVGMSLATHIYIKQKVYAFFRVFLTTRVYVYPHNLNQLLFSFFLRYSSKNSRVLGIFLNNPLPQVYDKSSVYCYIPVEKDIDGLGLKYSIKNLHDKVSVVPCTAAGVLSMLKQISYQILGKYVVILSTTNTVGMPLLREFLRKKAIVTILETTFTETVQSVVARADVVITATGRPGTINSCWLKAGAIVIDIGVSKKIGDVCIQGDVVHNADVFQNIVISKSVGRATLAYALLNTMVLYKKYFCS